MNRPYNYGENQEGTLLWQKIGCGKEAWLPSPEQLSETKAPAAVGQKTLKGPVSESGFSHRWTCLLRALVPVRLCTEGTRDLQGDIVGVRAKARLARYGSASGIHYFLLSPPRSQCS